MGVQQPRLLLLLCLLLLPAGAQLTTSRELYVKPTEDTSCPEPCHTLDEYVRDATQYFLSNTTFNFLPGNHRLTAQHLNVSGVTNLAMVAISNGTVDIFCENGFYMLFSEVANLTVEHLTFTECGFLLTDMLDLNLVNISIVPALSQHTWELILTNVLGNSSVTSMTILNALVPIRVFVLYTDASIWSTHAHNELVFKDFSVHSSGGLEILTELHQSSYAVSLQLDNLTTSYAELVISVHSNATNTIVVTNGIHVPVIFRVIATSLLSTRVTIADSVFNNTLVEVQSAVSSSGSGEFRNVTFSGSKSLVKITKVTNLTFIDCRFQDAGGNTVLQSSRSPIVSLLDSNGINFTNCEFYNNIATPVSAVDSTFILSGLNAFSNNTVYEGGAMSFYGHSYVTLDNGAHVHFSNNSAKRVGGVIFVDYLVSALCFFHFEGEYTCKNTSTPVPTVNLSFENNKAENGGDRVYGASLDTCILGDTHFGPDACNGWNFVSSVFHVDQSNGSEVSAITSDSLRACLCMNGRPSCTTVFGNLTHYPGDIFEIPGVAVGDRFGTVDGSVYAQLLPLNSGKEVADIDDIQRSQRVEHLTCSKLSYTILSNSSSVVLALTANSVSVTQYPTDEEIHILERDICDYNHLGLIGDYLRSTPVYININLLPCPLGFVLSGEKPHCTCDPQLENNRIPCNITTQTVQRSGTEWVNASFHKNTSSGVIVNKYCPNNYCKPETVNISLEHPDTQCAFNHSGILCGGCQSGLSLALGSAQCLSCSNNYLALLISFALAGFALVFFIKLLNLTVAKGTLNGLIFYANIVRANQVAWIPGHDTNILTVFIAWINLDLGIETCFFDGLDAYWKTWLQFVFPIYIWVIVIAIIVLSHYFTTAAKISGRSSVPVLATLFLLSYPKLLRTIISIFQASTIDYPDGTSAIVWSYDGNVSYRSSKHIVLFVVALIVTLFLWLPYTAVLSCAQWLQRIPSYRVSSILVKLKPFLDAYFGPLKDKHRYWVGLLLVIRGVLFITFATTPTSHSEIGLLVTLSFLLALQMYLGYVGPVYKKHYLGLLESSFLLNLGLLTGGTLYVRSSGGSQPALAYTSLGTAFAMFVVIITFHAVVALREMRVARKLYQEIVPRMHRATNRAEYEEVADEPDARAVAAKRPGVQEVMVSYGELREPVMNYLDPQT